jgi:hypothetical protein
VEILFKGVKKTKAKLRGISEIFTYSIFRLYIKRYGVMPLCIGGSIIDSYPEIRNDLRKIFTMFSVSSVIISITPLFQRSDEKFELLLSSLSYLKENEKISEWFFVIFLANLLTYSGVGFRDTNIGYETDFWRRIHSLNFQTMDELEKYNDLKYKVLDFFIQKINENFNSTYKLNDFIGVLEEV